MLIAGAILVLLLTGDDEDHGLIPWAYLVRRKLGLTLGNFITRSGSDLAKTSKAPAAAQTRAVDRGTERAIEDALRAAVDKIQQAAIDLFGPAGRAPAQPDQQLHDRTEAAATGIGRQVAVFAREQARMHTAMNLGATKKIWRTMHDNDVRSSHAEMEGQERDLADPFISGLGNRLMMPGDPDAPPPDTFGCRCRNSYRIPAFKTEVRGAQGDA